MLIENELRQQRELYDVLEPTKVGYEQRRGSCFPRFYSIWLGDLESNQDTQLQRLLSYR